jgi:small subunit ribosomal protein S3Ae
MAKARSRTAARKVKDKWKAKSWYNILAPASFNNITIADTLAENPNILMNRVTEVSLQDLTNDFRKSHIKLFFKVNNVEESNAHTQFIGHTLTSDYLRRMIRRKRSKIDGVYDVKTRDGANIRVKPFATTDKRIQNSQKRIVRETMKKTLSEKAKTMTMSELLKTIIDGKIGSDIYKNCKKLYPVKRVEIFKTEVLKSPTVELEQDSKTKIIEEPKTKETEKKEADEKKKTEKKPKEKLKDQKEPDEKTKPEETKEQKEEDTKAPDEENKKEEKEVIDKKIETEIPIEDEKDETPEEKPVEETSEKLNVKKEEKTEDITKEETKKSNKSKNLMKEKVVKQNKKEKTT